MRIHGKLKTEDVERVTGRKELKMENKAHLRRVFRKYVALYMKLLSELRILKKNMCTWQQCCEKLQ